KITFNATGTTNVTLSWDEPTNETDVTYEVNYWNTSSTFTVQTKKAVVTLQNLKSGTKYSVDAVRVGAGGSNNGHFVGSVFTKPMPVKSLWGSFSSADSISLFWTKPDGYQSTYSYRVQTNITSPSTLISNIKVTNETATIPNLTPGETYSFTVFTTAADNVTKSDPVSLPTFT
ncbi:hypothetical protein AB205_0209200, partial [Aquarana catesbeiana]